MLKALHQRGPQILGDIRLRKKGQKGSKEIGRYLTLSLRAVGIERNIRSVYSLARLGVIDIASRYPTARSLRR
jgi:hypothetical protein